VWLLRSTRRSVSVSVSLMVMNVAGVVEPMFETGA